MEPVSLECLPSGKPMKLCYCDESGTGDEPVAVMAGILVDAHRMHLTKAEWERLLQELSDLAGRSITEFHTRDFYPGNGVWREIAGPKRAEILSRIFTWLAERKHRIVYTCVNKTKFYESYREQVIPAELNTVWRFLGFHVALAIQKYCQTFEKNKGHTVFIFDNEERERLRFTDVIKRPPEWSDAYYHRKRHQERLDQLVDVPYFGDSQDVSLIQVADAVSFFLRRYAEIKERLVLPRYPDEEARIDGWIEQLMERSIGASYIYPKINRGRAEALFYDHASVSIRSLG
jgi:hypothetical protein